jgi:pimeloyl-ACP methyl ester carboxylesterase
MTTIAAMILMATALAAQAPGGASYRTIDVTFRTADGQEMVGKLTMPEAGGRRPVVMMIQTAEAQTVDERVQGPRGPIDFHDLYRKELAAIGVAFFSYEGRGVRTGDQPPRYVAIDRPAYNTSTLANKVQDAMAAVRALRARADVEPSRIFLTGVSEGTLLAAETATRIPGEIRGLVLSSVVADMRGAIKFMMTGGTFMQHQAFWDANHDGAITKEEFEADPRRIRRLPQMQGIELATFDTNGDGVYTAADRLIPAKALLDAVDAGNADAVGVWLKATAALETPEGWLKDHFAHPSTWTYLSKLDIPVGIFHGEADANTPVDGVRQLERDAKAAGKTRMEFHYYPALDHSLGGLDFFLRGAPSDGYKELFAYVKQQAFN